MSARGGEIYIHALQITRSALEDPPSITDGPGGRVLDYRIADFAALIKGFRLLPIKSKTKQENNLYKARKRINRSTHYFPLTLNTTIVYNLYRNLPWLPNFLRKIANENMSSNELVQCQQNILELYTLASKDEALPFSTINANR